MVVRAARFPLRALRTLADTGLATAVQQADEAGIGGGRELQRRYEDAIAQERGILYRLTVGDAAFSRALCITNQELSRRLLDDAHPRGRRNKRARHLETTLYRYLARAGSGAPPPATYRPAWASPAGASAPKSHPPVTTSPSRPTCGLTRRSSAPLPPAPATPMSVSSG